MTPEQRDNLDVVRTLPLDLTVRLGSCRLSIAQLLELGEGSVIELDRPVDAPVEVLAGGKVIARGEIVAIGERFGVRVTEIVRS